MTSAGVLGCSLAIKCIVSNIAVISFTYHLSKSVRRSVSLNICSAVLAKY